MRKKGRFVEDRAIAIQIFSLVVDIVARPAKLARNIKGLRPLAAGGGASEIKPEQHGRSGVISSISDIVGQQLPGWLVGEGAPVFKKGKRLRDRAEELRTNADNIHADECRRISLELAAMAEELADQWEALAVAVTQYLSDQAPAK